MSRRTLMAVFSLLLTGCLFAGEMVITIDDLPVVKNGRYDRAGQTEIVNGVMDALKRHRVKATGFVVGKKVVAPWQRDLLLSFLAAGHTLGNHTFSHPDLHQTGSGEFVADIDNCDRVLGSLAGEKRYFRYPLLHRGSDPEKRSVVQGWLRDHGYVVVPVTVDNDDYLFDVKYEKAIDVDPTNPFAYFHYGVARSGVKQYDQSFVMLEEASDKFGENKKWQSQILTYRGLNHKALKEYDKARDCFKDALKLDRNNEKARGALAEVYGK